MSSEPPLPVVCAVIHHDGKVLAARRDTAGALPLLWEFPGGKVEAGESPEDALHREILEELGIHIRITRALKAVDHTGDGPSIRLQGYLCVPGDATAPRPGDHCEIRWIRPEAAVDLEWAPADRPLVASLREWVPSPIH